jgi:hypothetical protein
MKSPVFESIYRDKLWRVELSEYGGKQRLSVWAHYRDRVSGDWKPCGGKREAPGFIVEPDCVGDLAETLTAIAAELRAAA